MKPHTLIGLVLLAISAGAVFHVLFTLLRRHRIAATETTSIEAARGGLVELQGVVEALQSILSPLTGEECVWFEFQVKERRTNNRGRAHWVTIRSGKGEQPFVLDDGTGRALIRPKGAAFHVDAATHGRSGTFDDPTPRERAALARVGVDPELLFGLNRTLRLDERRIVPGERLYVLGRGRRCGPAEAGDSGATLVVDDAGADFVISDKDEASLLSSLTVSIVVGLVVAIGAGTFGLALIGGAFPR